MATRYGAIASTLLAATAVGAGLYTAATAGDGRASLGLAYTRHGALITAQDAGAPDAVATVEVYPGVVGQVLTLSDGGLPQWAAGGAVITSGVDTSRPTCATSSLGAAYVATDTGVTYDCESDGASGGRWRVRSTAHLDNVGLRVAAAATTQTGTTSRLAPVVGTIVVYTRVATLPASISQHGTGNFSAGFQLEIGNTPGDRGQFSVYRTGSSPVRTDLVGASFTGGLGVVHGLALRMTASALRWSWDGGAVGSAVLTGTPSGSGVPWIGAPSSFHAHDVFAVRWLAEAVTDAELQTASGSAAVTARRIPPIPAT